MSITSKAVVMAAGIALLTASELHAQSSFAPHRVQTFVHYVNWFNGRNFRNTTTQPANGLGNYVSTDRHVISRHKVTLAEAGQVPLVSWWGKDDPRGDAFLDVFLDVRPAQGPDVRVSVLYEAEGILGTDAQGKVDFGIHETRARFVSDLIHLQRKYFADSERRGRFFTIDERPVVFVWFSHAFRGPFREVVAEAREHADVYLIGSNFTLSGNRRDEWDAFIPALDAVSAYGAYDPELLQEHGGPNERYMAQYFNGAAVWALWLAEHAPNTDLILPMSFAFDNSKSDRPSQPFYMNTFEATLFAEKVRLAIECSLAGNPIFAGVSPYIVFASFNEHFEGTPLERSTHYQDPARPYHSYGEIYHGTFPVFMVRRTFVAPTECEGLLF